MKLNSTKDINTEKIRSHLRNCRQASKSEIARATRLSFPTVTRILDALRESGEIRESGQSNSTGGRAAALYALNPAYALSLLIRVEGSGIHWVIKDLEAQIVDSGTGHFESGLLEQLDELVLSLQKRHPRLKAAVIGVAAMIADGAVEESVGFQELKGVNLPLHFQNLTELPLLLENDMNLVAMGHWFRSKEKALASVCMYYGLNGPGAGMVIGGELWRGVSQFAGELSFLPYHDAAACGRGEGAMLDFYVTTIQMYALLLNPSRIVLYSNPQLSGNMDEIRQRCRKALPAGVLPLIELSHDFELDYEAGLFALAQKLIP